MPQAVILFAHGARAAQWAEPFHTLRDLVAKAEAGQTVELAYLELMEPRLPEVIDRLAASGHAELRVVPVFLGAGSHVRRDLPDLVAAARQRWPTLSITLEPALGERPEVLAALAKSATKPYSGE